MARNHNHNTNHILELGGKELEQEIDRIAKVNPPRDIRWTQKETDILIRLHSKRVPTNKIGKILGRSYSSVANKLQHL